MQRISVSRRCKRQLQGPRFTPSIPAGDPGIGRYIRTPNLTGPRENTVRSEVAEATTGQSDLLHNIASKNSPVAFEHFIFIRPSLV